MDENTDTSLREDVRLLGEILGDVIRRQEGDAVYALVEKTRTLSKAARRGDTPAEAELDTLIQSLPIEQAHLVARAFAHFLTLANIAEQHHRIRRRRFHAAQTDAKPQKAGLDDTFSRLINAGIPAEELQQTVAALDIGLVLTAHPTQALRRTIILITSRSGLPTVRSMASISGPTVTRKAISM